MNVVIHQPHFFPWLGYFNKLSNADIFVVQNNVQFRKRYFQNRTLIRDQNNRLAWLTVPVHAKRSTRITDIELVDGKWPEKLRKTIYHYYHKKEYFHLYFDLLTSQFSENSSLLTLNEKTLKIVLSLLNINIQIKRSSSFNVTGSPSEKLATICCSLGATRYLFGEGGGVTYHGKSIFKSRGIGTSEQNYLDFSKRVAKRQSLPSYNLSILDFLFSFGAEKTRKLVNKDCNIN